MISHSNFRVIEYEDRRDGLHVVYESSSENTMCLRDASRMAAALSYARGAYVHVLPVTPGEAYSEWWLAGTLDREPAIQIIRAA